MSKRHEHLQKAKPTPTPKPEPERPNRRYTVTDDTTVTALSVTRDMIYGTGGAVFGVGVISLCGIAFDLVPDGPSLGASSWLSGSANATKIGALCLAVAAFAIPVHVGIWLPAKVLFAGSYIWRKAEVIVADVALALTVLAVIIVAVVAASPAIIAQFKSSGPSAAVSPKPSSAVAAQKTKAPEPTVSPLEPIAVAEPETPAKEPPATAAPEAAPQKHGAPRRRRHR